LNFLYLNQFGVQKTCRLYPSVTVVVPAYNEESTIQETIESILSASYPKDRLFVCVVNDGSTDGTEQVVTRILANSKNLVLINMQKSGKAAALNTALRRTSTELFACVDADSVIDKNALKNMMYHFENPKNAAVITALKVYHPRKILEKVQRLEYMLGILIRKIKASISTLAMTPGVLSVYRTDILKKLGGFDEHNITEDFEIAMRLKYYGYDIQMETSSYTYTRVPNTLRQLRRQRIRWFRGYIFNHLKYKDMFFSKNHRLMGYFQMPLNILGIILLVVSTIIVGYGTISHLTEFVQRAMLIKGYIPSMLYLPSIKELILGHDVQIMFPIYIGSLAGIYLFIVAHRQLKERFKHPLSIWAYFAVFPLLNFLFWLYSIVLEAFRVKRKW
jgi:cellulose synthase/poly-beta-1,6-N-acetylglucosamine synthase-like glycosyltransferase